MVLRWLLPVLVVLSGCGASTLPGARSKAAASARWADSRLQVRVPVTVVTVGYPARDAESLARSLVATQRVDQSYAESDQALTLDEDGPAAAVPSANYLNSVTFPNPVLPLGSIQVVDAPAALESAFEALISGYADPVWDANTVEDWLAQALPAGGIDLPQEAPVIVLLNVPHAHAWRIRYPTGTLEPVRVFGERYPMLVLDPSAGEDPGAGTGGYNSPLKPGDTELLAQMVHDAIDFRILHGAVYAESTAPCHAITSIAAIRATSVESVGLLQSVAEGLDPATIASAFNGLTDGHAFHDLKILSLPLDDPALEAVTRGDHPSIDLVRAYVTANWERYHVDHPGCEEYLNIVFVSDLAGVPAYTGVLPSGMAMYDSTPGKRLALTWEHDLVRLQDTGGPLSSCGEDCGRSYNYVNLLFAHETGHLLGLAHPHNYFTPDNTLAVNNSFASVWTTMSYAQEDRVLVYGAIDRASWMRNRAGFALLQAERSGRVGTPEWDSAMAAAARLDWTGTWEALAR